MGARVAMSGMPGSYKESAEINVVPFIDVMLVLLIIFMVAAPMATTSLQVDVPPASAGVPDPGDPIFLSLEASGVIHLGERVVTAAEIGPALLALTKGDTERRVMLRADALVRYGAVTEVINTVSAAGFAKVVMIGEEM
ncbi:Biopolymer transport protein ExbD [Alphaproteobacteria bacterium SO-S41]|nr:Biopolymer transport protein ExbD [Alphaproteobacteria bacterium SO-S41]